MDHSRSDESDVVDDVFAEWSWVDDEELLMEGGVEAAVLVAADGMARRA